MLHHIPRLFIAQIAALGSYVIFSAKSLRRMFYPLVEGKLVVEQMEFIGVKSILIVVLAAIMVGAVFAIQFGTIFRLFGAESLIGAAASFSLSKELAPVIGSFLVAGRCGSAMAAEVANMRVNDQIDALHIMAVNPISYLVAPRLIASLTMLPLLSCLFVLVGVLACYVIGVKLFNVDVGIFLEKIAWISKPEHIVQCIEKAVFFGGIIATVCCYKGFHARGGATGVGRATTEAVVVSLVSILIADFFISYLQFGKIIL
jgi:phospholipid/cholesterol/gamma-HCH transport system permease protein